MISEMDTGVMINLIQDYLLKASISIKASDTKEGLLKASAILNKLVKDLGYIK